MLAELHVAADRHEIHQVLGQQIEPLLEPPLIQQVGFEIQEVLDLLAELVPCERAHHSAAARIGGRPSNSSHGAPFRYDA